MENSGSEFYIFTIFFSDSLFFNFVLMRLRMIHNIKYQNKLNYIKKDKKNETTHKKEKT